MANKRVALVACDEYEYDAVKAAVKEALDTAGVTPELVNGKKVFIKANLIAKFSPSKCATTHPTVIAAIAEYIAALGGMVTIGDSPGGPMGNARIEGIYETTGMTDAARISGAQLNQDFTEQVYFNEKAHVLKQVTLMKAMLDADILISATKLKTHGMTGYTGAVKNMYGCIPGMAKVEYHYRMPGLVMFSQMLLDLCEYVNPQISVIDAIYGMEKDGPTAGVPKKLGTVIASLNPHAADVAALKLINVKPDEICTVARAIERGIIKEDFSDVEIIGDLEKLICKDFEIVTPNEEKLNLLDRYLPKFMHQWSHKWMTPRPVIQKNICKGCGECQRACPPKAIVMENKLPKIDLQKCIRCYCCHELCPFHAVRIKRPWVAKIR